MFKHDMPWLEARTSRVAFLEVMAARFPRGSDEFKLIEKAEAVTFDLNRGSVRYSGEPAINHMRGVALILTERLMVRNHLQVVTGIKHDNREDYPKICTHEFVEKEFGHQVDLWLSTVTRLRKGQGLSKEERNDLYFERFSDPNTEQEVVAIKLADVTYNGLTLDYIPSEKTGNRHRTLNDTKTKYLPIARKRRILVREIEMIIPQAEAFLANEPVSCK